MNALIAKADAIRPVNASQKRKRSKPTNDDPHNTRQDYTLHSVSSHTKTPKSLASIPAGKGDVPTYTPTQVPSKKLRTKLHNQHALTAQYTSHTESAQSLLALAAEDVGFLQAETPLEKTWRVSQEEIVASVGGEAAKGRRELVFEDGGVKRMRWTRNGRHLVLVSGKGGSTISSVDWISGRVNSQVQLDKDGARDVVFLQDQSFYAAAQRRNVFVYDKDGVEVHRLAKIIDPIRLDFLPWHWLLVSVTNTSQLSYTDTTTGTIVAQHSFTRSSATSTRLSPALCLSQNPHTAISYLGHTNGQVSLWTPNMTRPVVQVLAHLGGVSCVGVDPSDRGVSGGSTNSLGRYMATAGRDHKVKIWDCRFWKGVVREWMPRSTGGSAKGSGHAHADIELNWSQRGFLAVSSGGSVNVYHPPAITTPFTSSSSNAPPPLYLTHPIPHRPITNVAFQPFADVVAVGHAKGLSSLVVPGAGEPQFDSLDADPYENAKARREREVKALMDKLSPDMITLDPTFVGKLDPTVGKSITEDGVRTTTAAQSLLDDRDRKKLPPSAMTAAGADKEFARMSRVERLGVQGKLDLCEVGNPSRARASRGEGDTDSSDNSGDEDEEKGGSMPENKDEKEKKRMRGRNKTVKRFLRKQRKNVVDPAVIAIRAKVEKLRKEEKERKDKMRMVQSCVGDVPAAEESGEKKRKSALDRFAKRSG